MKPTIKDDCTHAYVGIVVLVAIFMGLFMAVMHGQALPNLPQATVKHQTTRLHCWQSSASRSLEAPTGP